jgi:hypothetical protein
MGAVVREDHFVFSPGSEAAAEAIAASGCACELRDPNIVRPVPLGGRWLRFAFASRQRSSNDRKRRNPVVAARSDEGPLTIRFTTFVIAHCQPVTR